MSNPIVTVGQNAPLNQTQAPQAKDPSAQATPQAAPPVDAPKKEDPFSPRFAALSRQEKAFREQQASFKAQREAQEREWAPKLEQARKVEELKTKAKTDRTAAMQLLQEIGMTYDDLTKLHLNGGKPTAEMIAEQARAEVEAIRREQAERESKSKTEAEARNQDHIKKSVQAFKGQIGEFLAASPDDFELTLNYQDPHTGTTGADLVYDLIDAHYDQTEKSEGTGRVMAHADAAKLVEDYLEKDYEEKVLSRKKIQAKLGKKEDATAGSGGVPRTEHGSAPDSGAPRVAAQGGKPITARTLTNADQSAVATTPRAQPKTREESIKEAAKLIRWS